MSTGNKSRRAYALSGCAGLALMGALSTTTPALAQDAAASEAEPKEVVVTGIRRGIQDAISAKRKSSSIVEAISAEDIGKLPDSSIAESIARLPGIAAQRTNGRAQTLSIRGLGPDFTVTTLNGREQVSTNNNRSVEFDQYPSELISQVLVYKTPNASMVTQGIAGTADLQTVRPLAFGKRAIALNYRREQNQAGSLVSGTSDSGDRYAFTYINQFLDKTLGVAFGYAHTTSPTQAKRLEAWGYPDLNSTTRVIGGTKPAVQSSKLTRDGFIGVVEWKPTDRLHIVVDAYHSTFEELQRNQRLEFPLQWSGAQLQPGFTVANGLVQSGTYTGVKTVVENYVTQTEATVNAIGFNAEYKLNDDWTLMTDISTSKVERNDIQVESTAGTGPGGSGATDTVKFTMNANGAILTPTLNYADFGTMLLTDPGGWGGAIPAGKFRGGYLKAPTIEDELTSIRLAAKRKLDNGIFDAVTVGFNRNERSKTKDGTEGFLLLNTATASVPTQFRQGSTNVSFFAPGVNMIQYDALGLYKSGFYGYNPEPGDGAARREWRVEETVNTYFIKGDINSTFLSVPVTGNLGVQWQKATQSGTSLLFVNGVGRLITQGTSYTHALPSLNLNFALNESTALRFGLGKTISRPRMDDLAAGANVSPSTDTGPIASINDQRLYWSGGGGNPNLKPWEATAVDLSLERYFGRKGYVSAAIYYKKLESFIFGTNVIRDFIGARPPADTPGSTYVNARASTLGILGGQANGKGGDLQGLELSASIPGELVSDYLDGFGVILSAAFNDSSVDPAGDGSNYDLPGLSRRVINSTVYYEKHGFSARVSSRYRGDFVGEVPDFQNSLEYRWVKAETVVDAQMSYAFQDGPAKGLSLLLQANNLTDEAFGTNDGGRGSALTRKYEEYGTTYIFGVNYKF
jgi:iron complex outermembrane recepter protein